jgi:hypothetical protein
MNDADFEMLELERIGGISQRLKKKGICSHGSRIGDGWVDWKGAKTNNDEPVTCRDCGKIATWAELDEDFNKYL